MKILHYSLGFPPYRSGGLTKFCVDLMGQQAREGHVVAMLWPGAIQSIDKSISIREHKDVLCRGEKTQSFEIINPLPVPLDEGIENIDAFTANIQGDAYGLFLEEFAPDVIHIHTLMGLHESFLQVAKKKEISLVFTTHDFFPICPKVTMFRNGRVCSSRWGCEECKICNSTALSEKKIQILQSPIYRVLKGSPLVKKLRKKHRENYFLSDVNGTYLDLEKSADSAVEYKKLRNYYYRLLKMMDIIHYNSSITKNIYEAFFDLPKGCIVNITHSDIGNHKKRKLFSEKNLRIRYLGPNGGAKGFYLLKDALDMLWEKQKNFSLDIHFQPVEVSPYMEYHDRYTYKELEEIFDDTDVLIAPSIWYETFGFTVLEALSYGVPVIISGTVGAKDILIEGAGIIVNNITADKLCDTIQRLTKKKLEYMNDLIVQKQPIMQIEEMAKELERKCYGWT